MIDWQNFTKKWQVAIFEIWYTLFEVSCAYGGLFMESDVYHICLKNVYRVLTRYNYPEYLDIPFPAGQLKKLTLVSFWRFVFFSAFPKGADLQIFDITQGRSRSLTKLLNGTEGPRFRMKWFQALSPSLSPELINALTLFFHQFLKQNYCRPDQLLHRLEKYIHLCGESCETEESLVRFLESILERSMVIQDILVRNSYILSWLSLSALFISCPNDVAFLELRRLHGVCQKIVMEHFSLSEVSVRIPSVITNDHTVLKASPLPSSQYVGRSEQFKQVEMRLFRNEHVAISGMGGIGKTEFLRQLLANASLQNHFHHLALVQYQNTLVESLTLSFFNRIQNLHPNDVLDKCKAELEQPGTLLIIDGMDAQDPDVSFLSQLTCPVLVTTRMTSLDGFHMIPMIPLNKTESVKLFALHWQGDVHRCWSDIDQLVTFLDGHPLLLTMLGKMCRIRFWSISELNMHFSQSGIKAMNFVENGQEIVLQDLLTKVFHLEQLPPMERKLLNFMAILPYASFTPMRLLPMAADITENENQLANALQLLADTGWLMRTSSGYAIHPALAENLRSEDISADAFPLLWKYLYHRYQDGLTPDNRPDLLLVACLLKHTQPLNRDALETLIVLEGGVISEPYTTPISMLLRKHREWLHTHPHPLSDEARYLLSVGYDSIIFQKMDELRQTIKALADLPPSALCCQAHYVGLTNMVENAMLMLPAQDAHILRLLEKIKPSDDSARQRIAYAAMMAERYRCLLGDHKKAAQLLEEAVSLIEQEGINDTSLGASTRIRLSYAYADMHRYDQAAQILEQSLTILRRLGYSEDSPSILPVRGSCAYMLMMGGQFDEALSCREAVIRIYRRKGQTRNMRFAHELNAQLQCLLYAGRSREAGAVAEELLGLTRQYEEEPTRKVMSLVYVAAVRIALGDPDSSLQLLEEARAHMEKTPKLTASLQPRLECVEAARLYAEGKVKQAARKLQQWMPAFLEKWGDTVVAHRARLLQEQVTASVNKMSDKSQREGDAV